MKFVNEEIKKLFNNGEETRFDMTLSGTSNYVLNIKKNLDSGYATDNIFVDFVRIFFEGSGTVSINSIKIYKFGGIAFEKKTKRFNNDIDLAKNVSISNNGYIDVPIGIQDETFDILFTASGFKNMYVAVNGGMTCIDKSQLEEYRKLNP